MIDHEPPAQPDLLLPDEQPEPVWTRWRILYTVIAILIIITFLAMILWPWIISVTQPLPPPPPTRPLPRV